LFDTLADFAAEALRVLESVFDLELLSLNEELFIEEELSVMDFVSDLLNVSLDDLETLSV